MSNVEKCRVGHVDLERYISVYYNMCDIYITGQSVIFIRVISVKVFNNTQTLYQTPSVK